MRINLILLFIAISLQSCNNDDQAWGYHGDPSAVHFTAEAGSLSTKTNPTAGDQASRQQFNVGDDIKVNNGGEYVRYTRSATGWDCEENWYLRWDSDQMTFNAYYPISQGTTLTTFTVPIDQGDVGKIANADYMTVTNYIAQRPEGGENINLQFKRRTARIVVNISSFNDQWGENPTVATLDIFSKNIGENEVTYKGINSFKSGLGGVGTTFTALVAPGALDTQQAFITLKVAGDDRPITVTGVPVHEAGKSYTYQLTVGKDALVIGDVTVNNWETGAVIPDGETEPIVPAP